MAILNQRVADKTLSYTGAFGNLSALNYTYTFAAAAQNDIAYLGEIPNDFIIYGVLVRNAALGSSTGIKVGYAPMSGASTPSAVADAFFTDSDTAAAATSDTWLDTPVKNADAAYLTVTNYQSGAATGLVRVTLIGSFEGA